MISPKVYATENSPEELRDMEEAREELKAECKELAKELAVKWGMVKVFGIEPEDASFDLAAYEVLLLHYQDVKQTPGFWWRVKEYMKAELEEHTTK